MTTLTERCVAWIRAIIADNQSIADEVAMGNLRRLRWLVLAVLPLNLVHVAVFWFGPPGATPLEQAWKNAIGWAHLGMALWIVVPGLAAHLLSRRSTLGPGARALQTIAPATSLLFPVILAVIDQWVTPNISPFLIGCVFTSLLFQMRPALAIWLYVIAYALFFAGLGLTQDDAALLLSNRVNGLGAAVMGAVLALVLWHKNAGYVLLQRELTSRNAALLQQQKELVWLAKRDPLTELFNRGEFLRLAELELKRAQRHHTDTSAIMVDLDHFKRINDAHGHPAGDTVLRHAATLLLGGVRATDVVARIGGEEFMVLLPHTSLDAAQALAEKLMLLLRQTPAPVASDLEIAVTASFGVGTLPAGQHATVDWLYAAADHALYEAKRLGRDRVEKTEPDPTLTPSDFQRMRRQ